MGSVVRKVYCGPARIISSLGQSTLENYLGVDNYMTNSTQLSDGTPVCLIDKRKLDLTALESYTFVEQLSLITLNDVMARSRITLDNKRTLLIISTTKGNIDYLKDDLGRSQLWAMANRLEAYFKCINKPVIVSNACVSGIAAVIMGTRLIEQEKYDHVYVVGVDVASEFVVSGFKSFKSISPTVCKPYDLSRDGLTLGEGCGAMLLTSNGELSESKVVVSGGGISDDANHISGPSRTGDGLAFAIEAAMSEAQLKASDISFINAHGTGTSFNDEMESRAFTLLSLTDIPCNSLKPYLGHTLGASGVMEIILSAEQLKNDHLFGIKGYSENGVPFELNVSDTHRNIKLTHCLKTASGFGGTNAAVILSKDSMAKVRYKCDVSASIVEAGSVEILKSESPFAEFIRSEYKTLGETNLKFFKMDNLSKLGYVASCKLMSEITLEYPMDRIGIVLANRNSSLDTDLNHQNILDQHMPEGVSPAVFVYTLANIVAAEIAIRQKFQGELMMFVSEHKEMCFLKEYSHGLINDNRCDAVVYGWCDLLDENYNTELKLIKRV